MNYKEILIFVAGTTPQIITETIYALSQKAPSIYPDEIFIITTSTGRKRIEDTLLKQGALKDLVREYSLPDIRLTEDSFIIVRDAAWRSSSLMSALTFHEGNYILEIHPSGYLLSSL